MPGSVQPVHLVENRLVWPVTFLYPEYQTSDFIQEFHEDSTLVFMFFLINSHLSSKYSFSDTLKLNFSK